MVLLEAVVKPDAFGIAALLSVLKSSPTSSYAAVSGHLVPCSTGARDGFCNSFFGNMNWAMESDISYQEMTRGNIAATSSQNQCR